MGIKNENLKQFIDRLYTDKDILYKFIQYKSSDELYEYALTIKSGYTKEEFLEALNNIISESELSYKNQHIKLSPEYEESVSGGVSLKSVDDLFNSFISSADLLKKGWDFGTLMKKIFKRG